MALLELRKVAKSFGAIKALADVDLKIGHGEIVGLMGDNGAGKSTLIKLIAGNFPKESAAAPGDRLTGQSGWTEVAGCPLYTDDDFPKAVQQMEDTLGKYADLDAFIPTGGFPQFVPDAYEQVASKHTDKIASGALALVVADTLPVQIELMKKGLSAGQVGQRPFEMGYKTMYFLKDIKDGKAPPEDPTYTGLDVCTPKTADTCVGGGGS